MRFPLSPIAATMLLALVHAQTFAATVAPDAGQAIREIQSAPPQLPNNDNDPLGLTLPDAPTADVKASGPSAQITGFTISGNQAIDSAPLLALLNDLRDRQVSLGELQAGANRITLYYRAHGYPLARAYLPPQDIDGGVVQIAVLEGRYGEIQVHNNSRLRSFALTPLDALKPGSAVQAGPLERSLLLLRDMPGVDVQSTLKPGATVGATDLSLDITSGPLISGSVDADNYGNEYTGEYRVGGTLNLDNPLGLGDQLTLRALDTNEDQHYYRVAYQLPLGPWTTQLGVAYSDMDYQLGRDFDVLGAHGNAQIASIYAIQPLIRSRDFSLYAQLQFDDKKLKDDIDLFASTSDKRSHLITASVNGNSRDGLLGGGLNSFSLGWSRGSLNIEDDLERLIDQLTAQTQGNFNKANLSLLRLQHVTERVSLYGQFQGQWADGNLDSSEKMTLGGAYGVRAYPQGEVSGDQGWLANVELRYALPQDWQASVFVDHGEMRLNKNAWVSGENHQGLSGAGFGANWANQNWRVNASVAWRIGNDGAQSSGERTPRIWGQVSRYF
jgi:hemolysin activation/secretion protein